MPIKKAAKEALRHSKKRRQINIKIKDKLKETIKKLRGLIKNGKKEEAKKSLKNCYQLLDRAAKKGVIKKNNASRKKSRLTLALNKIGVEKKK